MFRDELGETFDHLKQAASHGADSVSTTMRPRVSAARTMAAGTAAGAMARMAAARKRRMEQAGGAARKMTPMGRKKLKQEKARQQRGRRIAGLLAIGAAVGAVGALVGRRRRQTSWEVYDTNPRPPKRPVEMSESSSGSSASTSHPTSGPPSASQTRQPMPGKGTRGVGPLADQARSALSGAEPAGSEAEATAPITQPSSNQHR